MRNKLALSLLVSLVSLGLVLSFAACQGKEGPAGAQGATGAKGDPGASSGTLTGKVTNSLTKAPVASLQVTLDPAIAGVTPTTDANGAFSATLPIGTYTLSLKKDGYTAATATASVLGGQTTTKDVALSPASKVLVNAGKDATSTVGGSVTIAATAEALDGSQITGYSWTQTGGAPATIANAGTASTSATLANAATYKAELMKHLERATDRLEVQGINPEALILAQRATFKVTVTTSSGSYSDSVDVNVTLPYAVATGLANVPTGVPVLLRGKTQNEYSWTLAGPSGSTAALTDSTTNAPSFTPDVAGKYTATEAKSGAKLEITAGTWAGSITGLDAQGRPLAASCTICHNDKLAPDKFTDWAKSGHAEILTNNLNTSATYGEQCFSCHTVGFNKDAAAKNGGIDDASDYGSFLTGGILGKPSAKNFADMIAKFANTAKMANIQCENCHGPNNTPLHGNGTLDPARIDLGADVCATCHGEPLRHGRFQQWEISAHSNIEEPTVARAINNASCGRCHSAQGFIAWLKQGDLTKAILGKDGKTNATADELRALGMSEATIVGQTCAACHDPHKLGTKTGEPNDVILRVDGDTAMLPSGYKAVGVGRGALCITCHNTRNGAKGDAVGLPANWQAPHAAAQGDVLMGENAYFVPTGARSKHSFIENTCVTCHMQLSPPPPEFSYQGAGTNHSFVPSLEICSKCHGEYNGGTLQESVEAKLEELGHKMGAYLISKLPDKLTIQDYTVHELGGKSYDVKSAVTAVDKANIASAEPTEPHGQQGFIIKFKAPVTFSYTPTGEAAHTVSLSEAEVQLANIFAADGKTPVIPANDPLVRAGWNYFLIHGDGSEGVHNPSWTFNVLNASIAALK